MPVYHVRIGCSLSAAKVVPGFHGQKGRCSKPFRRQSPHFHFIAGSILTIKPCLSQALPFFAPETKTTDPTEKRIKKMSNMREAGKKKKLKLKLPLL